MFVTTILRTVRVRACVCYAILSTFQFLQISEVPFKLLVMTRSCRQQTAEMIAIEALYDPIRLHHEWVNASFSLLTIMSWKRKQIIMS